MLMLWLAAAGSAVSAEPCRLELISAAEGENHVLFHGVSPDGRTLAVGWDRGTRPAIERGAFLLDLKSGKRTDLPALNNAPSFSRDGRFLVSANYPGDPALKTEIVEFDRATGKTRTYASAPSLEWLATYAPDGRSVLFNSTRSGTSDIYRGWRADGRIERVTDDSRYEAHAQFIDGGRRILFHRSTKGDNYDVIMRDLASGKEKVIGATESEEAYPAMSPNGGWIAFSAVTAGATQPNLFIMARDGSHKRQLTTGAAKDAYATWAPDGRAIYFVRFAEDGSKICRIGMRGNACVGSKQP